MSGECEKRGGQMGERVCEKLPPIPVEFIQRTYAEGVDTCGEALFDRWRAECSRKSDIAQLQAIIEGAMQAWRYDGEKEPMAVAFGKYLARRLPEFGYRKQPDTARQESAASWGGFLSKLRAMKEMALIQANYERTAAIRDCIDAMKATTATPDTSANDARCEHCSHEFPTVSAKLVWHGGGFGQYRCPRCDTPCDYPKAQEQFAAAHGKAANDKLAREFHAVLAAVPGWITDFGDLSRDGKERIMALVVHVRRMIRTAERDARITEAKRAYYPSGELEKEQPK